MSLKLFGKRPPRFRLRTLMIIVAAAAIPLATWVRIEARRDRFNRIAAYHLSRIVGTITIGTGGDAYGIASITSGGKHVSEKVVDLDMWHLGLSRKYERAADRPWLPVAPDPDPPGREDATGP